MLGLHVGTISLLVLMQLAVALPPKTLEQRWANESTPVINLGYAQYQGTYDPDTNISYFFGIRYGQAPTGGCFHLV